MRTYSCESLKIWTQNVRISSRNFSWLLGREWSIWCTKWHKSSLILKHYPKFSTWTCSFYIKNHVLTKKTDFLNDSELYQIYWNCVNFSQTWLANSGVAHQLNLWIVWWCFLAGLQLFLSELLYTSIKHTFQQSNGEKLHEKLWSLVMPSE
jgi:hypothetical protein